MSNQKLSLKYADLSHAGLVKISEIADILEVTPKRAREIFLVEAARHQSRPDNKPARKKKTSTAV